MRLTNRVSRDWMIDCLISKGVPVEYWDVVPLLRGELKEFGAKKTDYLRTFKTYNEIEAAIRLPENNGAFYVMIVSYSGRFVRLFRLLSKFDCKLLQMTWGALPIKSAPRSRLMKLALLSPLQLFGKACLKAKAIAYKKMGLVKPFEMVFAGGGVLMQAKHFAKKIVPVNSVDYDRYIDVGIDNAQIIDRRYAVFLDNNLPYHSDFTLTGVATLRPPEYYDSLNSFFQLLEVKYRVRVVIAAHPTANYVGDVFHGREIVYGKAAELVKDADFAISHHSTSISYVVLNTKPVVFIYTDEMKQLYQHNIVAYIHDFSDYLGASIYNVNEVTDASQIQINPADHLRYETYKYKYLTSSQSENVTTQEVFLSHLSAEWMRSKT